MSLENTRCSLHWDHRPRAGRSAPGRLLVACVLLGVVLQTHAAAVLAQDQPRLSNDPRVQRLNDAVYRHELSRALAAAFETARDELNSGKTDRGLERLQQILNQPFDTFVNLPGNPRPSSLRGQITQLFNQLPRQTVDAYERRFGSDAQQLLERIERDGSVAQYRAVVRQYPYTRAGFTALDRLATDYFDREHFELAAHCWLRLVSQPAYRRFLTTHTLVKSQLAFEAVGWDEQSAAILRMVEDREVDIGGRPVRAGKWLADRDLQRSVTPAVTWNPFGNGAHNATVDATVPWQNPLWLHEFLPESHEEASSELQNWLRERQGKPLSVANFAIAVGHQVLVRDATGLRCLDARTGETQWVYPLGASFLGAFAAIEAEAGSNDLARRMGKPYMEAGPAYANNSVRGTLASDGQRVYFVDGGSLRHTNFPSASDSNRPNRDSLVALDLHDLDENRHPRVLWTLGSGMETSDRPDGDHSPGAPSRGSSHLDDVLFLGAPACVGGVLYVTIERDRQLSVTAVEPYSGEVLWTQGLGFVQRAADRDHTRAVQTCTPAIAGGTLICPTHENLLVGIDAVDGTLRWSYFHGDVSASLVPSNQRPTLSESFGHPGFPATPVIEGDRVVYLPRHSRWIHCVDAQTGAPLWKVPRATPRLTDFYENGDEYIGAIHQGIVVIIGQRNCRGLSLADGQEVWSHFYGMPSGRGLLTGDTYLVPLESGRVAQLDVTTGRDVGIAVPQHILRDHQRLVGVARGVQDDSTDRAPRLPQEWFPGNLLAVNDRIVSVGVKHIVGFEQAGARLQSVMAQLDRDTVQQSTVAAALAGSTVTGSVPLIGGVAAGAGNSVKAAGLTLRTVQAAALELSLGRIDDAYGRLSRVHEQNSDAEARRIVADLMRDILHLKIDLTGDPDGTLLAALERLSHSPRQRAAYLFRAGDRNLQLQEVQALLAVSEGIDKLTLADPLPHPGDSTHLQTRGNRRTGILQTAARTFRGDARSLLAREIQELRTQALDQADVQSMKWLLQSFPQFDAGGEIRQRLAEFYAREGRVQHSELLLLDGRNSEDPQIAINSTLALAALWQRCGLYEEAAGLIEELAQRSTLDVASEKPADLAQANSAQADSVQSTQESAGTDVDESESDDQFHVNSDPLQNSQLWQGDVELSRAAWEQLRLPSYPLERVVVAQDDWAENDPLTFDSYNAYRSRGFPLPINNSFFILDKGTDQRPELTFINRYVGRIQSRIPVSMMTQTSLAQLGSSAGHFFLAASNSATGARVYGMSLLGERPNAPLWELAFGSATEESAIGIGPVSPVRSIVQIDDRIVAIDSTDGSIHWERRKQPIESGVLSDPGGGMLGDDRVLVVFEHDRETYNCYDTVTGTLLSKGKVDSLARQEFGRRLFFESRVDGRRLFHLWDPLLARDEYVFTVPAYEVVTGRTFSTRVANEPNCVAFVTDERELIVYDVRRDEYRLRARMDGVDWQELNAMEVFSDGRRYFTALQYRNALRLGHLRRAREQASRELSPNTLRPGFLPGTHVAGALHAFDAGSGRQLWAQEMPATTVLHLSGMRLPFLICASRLTHTTRDQYLDITCVDSETGEILGENAGLQYDHLLHYEYDPDRRHVALQGAHSRIGIRFGPSLQRMAAGPNVE